MQQPTEDPKLLRTYKGHKDSITSVSINAYCTQLVSGSTDTMISVWNLDAKAQVFKFLGHRDAVYDVKFSPLGNQIASASKDQTVRLWTNTADGTSFTLKAHNAPIRSVNYSSDGQLLLTGSEDKTLKVFRLADKKQQLVLTGQHKNWVKVGIFSPDDRLVASGGQDKTVFVWDLESKTPVSQFYEHLGTINDLKYNRDGTVLASCSQDHKIKLFDMRSKRQIVHFDAHGDSVNKIDFHPEGRYLLSSSTDSKLKIWDIRKPSLEYTLFGHTGSTNACAFSKKGDYFVTGGADSLIMLWKSNLYPAQTEYIQHEQPPAKKKAPTTAGVSERSSLISGKKSFGASSIKNQGAADTIKNQQQSATQNEAFTDDDVPEEVLQVVDKISEQMDLVIKGLMSLQKRVCASEQTISKLNLLIYKKLEHSDKVQKKLFSTNQLQSVQLRETIKYVQVVKEEAQHSIDA